MVPDKARIHAVFTRNNKTDKSFRTVFALSAQFLKHFKFKKIYERWENDVCSLLVINIDDINKSFIAPVVAQFKIHPFEFTIIGVYRVDIIIFSKVLVQYSLGKSFSKQIIFVFIIDEDHTFAAIDHLANVRNAAAFVGALS